MKIARPLALLGVMLVVITVFSLGKAGSATPTAAVRPAWEHLVLEREGNIVSTDRELAGKINKLGDEGWEMVAVSPVQQDGTTKRMQFYFKRPKS